MVTGVAGTSAIMSQASPSRSVLLVAFHFPPCTGSSGLHRTVALSRHLPEYGWSPVVLTASPRAYAIRDATGDQPSPSLTVSRALALDTVRHLSIAGRYPRILALPDRWVSWVAGAIPSGLMLIARHRPKIIWSTYPIATAHLIGWALHRMTGVPWIADFRDPMVEFIDGTWYPLEPSTRRTRESVERRVARDACATTFCTAAARKIFVDRHGWNPDARLCEVIENGYDESDFAMAMKLPSNHDGTGVHLVHSGTLYPGPDRDPVPLLQAVARLRERGHLPPRFRLTLRATGFDEVYRPVIEQLGLSDIVELGPPIPYHKALREMLDADGLLLVQGSTSNPAIPAKTYEYLRAAKPILALVASGGETESLLRRLRVGVTAPVTDVHAIERSLREFLDGIANGRVRVLTKAQTDAYSRRHRVGQFAELMGRAAACQAEMVAK